MPTPTHMPPSIMSHVSVGTNDYPRAKAFYDAVLGTLHIGVVMEHAGAAVAAHLSAAHPFGLRRSGPARTAKTLRQAQGERNGGKLRASGQGRLLLPVHVERA